MNINGEGLMRNSTDILILTATFGAGHLLVSKAIKQEIQQLNESLKIDIFDVYEIISPNLCKSMYKGYELLIKNSSDLYNYFYYKRNDIKNSQTDDMIYTLYLSKFAEFIFERKPKIIISTFPMCSGFVSKFKEKYNQDIALVTCITDVVDSWEWIYPKTDRYFVATSELKDKLVNKGVNKSDIIVTGIPIREGFLQSKCDNNLSKNFGIKPDDIVVLIMGGGMGIIPDDRNFYRWLNGYNNVKTIIITGNNRKLFNKLSQYNDLKNIIPMGYVDNIYELMRNSHILISKAGGVTLFEAIASKIPIIAYKPVLGQEIENCKFITSKKIGSVANNIDELRLRLYEYLKYNGLRNEVLSNIAEISESIDKKSLSKNVISLYSLYDSQCHININ